VETLLAQSIEDVFHPEEVFHPMGGYLAWVDAVDPNLFRY
jgi:hypothetical protein